jgi:hypothetical protein
MRTRSSTRSQRPPVHIAYSLYGDDKVYLRGLVARVDEISRSGVHVVWHLYHDNTVPRTSLDFAREAGGVLHDCTERGFEHEERPMWRFDIMGESGVDLFFVGDLDDLGTQIMLRRNLASQLAPGELFATEASYDYSYFGKAELTANFLLGKPSDAMRAAVGGIDAFVAENRNQPFVREENPERHATYSIDEFWLNTVFRRSVESVKSVPGLRCIGV